MRSTIRGSLILAALLVSTSALAAPKLMRPVSVQDGRLNALQAAGVQNIWRSGHHVTLLGFSQTGKTVVMVKSVDLKKPAVVALEATRGQYGREIKATKLDNAGMKKVGLVTPSKALQIALESGGIFGKVKGKTEFAGASNKGFAYKFTVTPKSPVQVKTPYGTYTIQELTRVVNVMGQGESAYPSPGKHTWNYQPGN